MNGKIAAFLRNERKLLLCCDIAFCFFWFCAAVDPVDDLSDGCVDFLICENFLYRVCEQDIAAPDFSEGVFLLAPTLSDPSFQKVSLDGALKEFLRYRYKNAVILCSGIRAEAITQSRHLAVPAFGKKL